MTTVDLEAPKPPAYRSVSQRNQMERCGYAYYLSRIVKAWNKPAAWLPMGSAVHEALEMWEKSGRRMTVEEAQDVFRDSYEREVSKYTDKTPNFDYWFASGPYKAPEDLPRRFNLGLEHVARYVDWAMAHPNEKVWVAPGYEDERCDPESYGHVEDCDCRDPEPAIELAFNIELAGIPIRGFIDLVVEVTHPAIVDKRCEKMKANEGIFSVEPEFTHINGKCTCTPEWKEIVVRDHKTGNSPGDDFQLGVYGVAISEMYDVPLPEAGDYFMTKTGKPTFPYPISKWTPEKVGEEFVKLEEAIQNGDFEPKPEPDKCKFCDVALACTFRRA